MRHENCKQVEIPASTTAATVVDNLCIVSLLTILLSATYIEGRTASRCQNRCVA